LKSVSQPLTDPNEWWKEYDSSYAGRTWKDYRYLLAEVVRHAESLPILDVGCGYGYLLECGRNLGVTTIGLEASADAIQKCKQLHPNVDIRLWKSSEKLPVDDASIGGVVINEVVDHISMDDNAMLFQEIHRVLKPRGIAIVKSPSRYNREETDKGHISFFSPREMKDFVSSAGFEVIEQPFVPLTIFGTSRLSRMLLRGLAKCFGTDRYSARIDLVARKNQKTRNN